MTDFHRVAGRTDRQGAVGTPPDRVRFEGLTRPEYKTTIEQLRVFGHRFDDTSGPRETPTPLGSIRRVVLGLNEECQWRKKKTRPGRTPIGSWFVFVGRKDTSSQFRSGSIS